MIIGQQWIENRLTKQPEETKAQEVRKKITRSMLIKKGDSGKTSRRNTDNVNMINKTFTNRR